ncbi:MAG TPA: hypothetical protein VFV31_01220 [Chitinophagaceae bacterium]|nr:hypothetical protein [Chitinophagaceae bacterium]
MENPFIVLKDQQLSSVVFIQDYLQLDFDGYTVTCYDWPMVILLDGKFAINDKEYRNVLCSLIAKKVNEISFIEDEMLSIGFQSGEKIEINLKNANGEVIYFTTPEGEWSSI